MSEWQVLQQLQVLLLLMLLLVEKLRPLHAECHRGRCPRYRSACSRVKSLP